MSREITHEAHGPAMIDESDLEEQDGSVAVCQCGLTDEDLLCDGSHESTTDEAEDARYKYEGDDDENPRHEIKDMAFADD